jgi:hypothetical protein
MNQLIAERGKAVAMEAVASRPNRDDPDADADNQL